MKFLKSKYLSLILLTVSALILGIIGHFQIGEDNIYTSFLLTLKLFKVDFDVVKPNILIEISRWLAAFIVLKVTFNILASLKDNWKLWCKIRRKDSYAIHGDSALCDTLCNNIGSNAFHSDSPSTLRANHHVLLFNNDTDALNFFEENEEYLLRSNHVHIGLNDIRRESFEVEKISLFNMAENCARFYWNHYPVLHAETIVLVGTGDYANYLLTHGLLTNVFSVKEGVTYHIFGDFKEYTALHTELSKVASINIKSLDGDSIFFHDEPWYKDINILKTSDRVILCNDSETNTFICSELLSMCNLKNIHIRMDSSKMCDILFYNDFVKAFGTMEQLCTPEIIIQEKLMEQSQKVHAMYLSSTCSHCNNNSLKVCLSCRKFLEDWRKNLSSFTRYSNVAVADHIPTKLHLLGLNKEDVLTMTKEEFNKFFGSIPKERMQELQEIEHIRWSRYHYMNNWQYSTKKDNKNRKHCYLVPYSQLTKAIQDKDGDNYKVLWDLINS